MIKRIKVLLADDHTVIREGLRMLLETSEGFEVIGEASNGLEAVDMARELRPDVIVMDLTMPNLNGLEAARRILHEKYVPHPRILILSAYCDDSFLKDVAILGIQGYLVKKSSVDIISRAIRDIYNGKTYYTPGIGEKIQQFKDSGEKKFFKSAGNVKQKTYLTSRESEVLQLISEGESNKEIASDLSISIKTVEKHRHNLMEKLNIHDIAGLTRYAISEGIIESSSLKSS